MIKTITLLQPLHDCRDKALAGGKAVNLGILLRAGFQCPRRLLRHHRRLPLLGGHAQRGNPFGPRRGDHPRLSRHGLARGRGAILSATAEDMAEASMAGQYDTFLDIQDEESLLNRVRCCWASLDSPRTRAYLKEHGIELSQVAMAVVVQRLVPSDVAGVLFTANPQTRLEE